MRILLIENDSSTAEYFLNALSQWDHKTEWSVTGADGLERIKRRNFELILMDLSLPDIQGHELILQIKKMQPEVGIVTMTNSNCRELELQIRKQGIIFYMVKPFSKDILNNILDHISKRRSGKGLAFKEGSALVRKYCITAMLMFVLLTGFPLEANSENENIHMRLKQALEEISRLKADVEELKKLVVDEKESQETNVKKNGNFQDNQADSKSLALSDGWRLKPYGYLKFDMSYDDSTVTGDNGDYVVWVPPESQGDSSDGKTSFTARQTRLGSWIYTPGMAGKKLTGRIEIDFYNPEFAAENKSSIQMRHAYGEMTGPDWSVLFGQTSDIISPLVPSTLNYPVAWFAGNVGYRHPQLRFARWWKDTRENIFKIETALSRQIRQDSDGLGVDDGQDADIPSVLGRVSLSKPCNNKIMEVGISGHYGQEEIDSISGRGDVDVTTWSANADIKFPIANNLEIKGECFLAENFDSYFGGIGQGVNPITNNEIRTSGAWLQLGYSPLAKWEFNVGGGYDDPRDEDLFPGARAHNGFAFGNAKWSPVAYFSVGLEASYWKTRYIDDSDGDDVRIQNSWILSF